MKVLDTDTSVEMSRGFSEYYLPRFPKYRLSPVVGLFFNKHHPLHSLTSKIKSNKYTSVYLHR